MREYMGVWQMNTFVIAGKRYRVKSKPRFLTFITAMIVMVAIIAGYALGGGVSGTEKQAYKDVTVKSGDTLWSIARANKPDDKPIRQYVSEIRAANSLDTGYIYPGQVVKAPIVP
ncbi:MAG: LysM peptidoglycan-binding domain-containing protein [Clostridiales Family XIII bacterium]|jgi:nucleoid-associated protein YgaU|nr:LysM peptidoglycan-binding domain-containing protein [Clostridiales Family XIII bacterium]